MDVGERRAQVVHRVALTAVLFATGFAALALQVVWQRLVALHVGVDVEASAVVVAAFLTGLGVGTLLGGRLADRVPVRHALLVVAGAETGVAVAALASPWLLYELFLGPAAQLAGRPSGLVATFLLLTVPTTLMGLSLPVAARVVADPPSTAGRRVGWLYAVNTAGAALGALVAGWYLIGTFGYAGSARWCAGLGVGVAAVLVALSRIGPTNLDSVRGLPGAAPRDRGGPVNGADREQVGAASVLPWLLLYAASGALALGLQQTFFRLVGATMRSNSYSFATVLALYLTALAVGTALGARFVGRSDDPMRTFFWLQSGVGLCSVAGLVVVTGLLPALGLDRRFSEWFNSDGFASGFDFSDPGTLLLFAVLIPGLLVAPPVVLMGASFPFAERGVVERLGRVGGATGAVVAANTFGNVAGAALAGFLLIDRLGTAGTHRLLAVALIVLGVVGAALVRPVAGRFVLAGSVGVLGVALLALTPTNQRLWEFFAGADHPGSILVSEDAACASIIERHGPNQFQLSINGTSQNGYPFDDFHVLIGLVPSLASADPGPALAVGFGIGSTSYSLLADRRRGQVTTVELCGGHYTVARQLAEEGHREYQRLFTDPRHRLVTGDGRHHLTATTDRYDAVVVDTLRVTSPGSGQHLSREFYELVDSVLTDDGVFVQWVPTLRTLNTAAQVFPHLVTLKVAEYGDSEFMVGSRRPLKVVPEELVARFDRHAAAAFPAEQRNRLREFLAGWSPSCVNHGRVVAGVPPEFENRDLQPRDEFHLNNGFIGEAQTFGTCPGAPVGTVVQGRGRS